MNQLLQEIWDEEHKLQATFNRMHSSEVSGCVEYFQNFLLERDSNPHDLNLLDLGCGKGRNSIYLARQGFQVTGIDFSQYAIKVCKERAKNLSNVHFLVSDLSQPMPFENESFDAIFDINTTVCIPFLGRQTIIKEAKRVLKNKGYYFFYGIGPSDLPRDSGPEANSGFLPGTKNFEKQYSKEELLEAYEDFTLIEIDSKRGEDIIQAQKARYSMWKAVFIKE